MILRVSFLQDELSSPFPHASSISGLLFNMELYMPIGLNTSHRIIFCAISLCDIIFCAISLCDIFDCLWSDRLYSIVFQHTIQFEATSDYKNFEQFFVFIRFNFIRFGVTRALLQPLFLTLKTGPTSPKIRLMIYFISIEYVVFSLVSHFTVCVKL